MSRVSVVIPAHNAAAFIAEALDSVFAQDLTDPEVVVVDDGSSDRTAQVVRGYGRGVRLLTQPASGSARARNAGIAATTAELIAFLDADDLWVPEKSALQIPVLERDETIALVFSDMIAFDEAGVAPRTYFRERGFRGRCAPSSIFLHDMVSTPTVVLRRSCLATVGLFDDSLPIGQDTDLWFRIALAFPFTFVDRPLVRRRLHAVNVTRNARLLARCTVEVWERYLERCVEREPEIKDRLIEDFARKHWNFLFEEGCSLRREGRTHDARRLLGQAIRLRPLRFRSYAFYLASLLGVSGSLSGTGATR